MTAKVNLSDSMIFGIAQVDKMLALSVHVAESLWMMELSLLIRAINKANPAVSDNSRACHIFFVDHDQSIVG